MAASTAAPPATQNESRWFRLNPNVKPSHYDLLIKSDIEDLTFSGVVTIHLDIIEDTDEIEFNASRLRLSKALLASDALKTQSNTITTLSVDAKHERASVKTAGAKLPKGSKATLTIAFGAEITNSMMGYYRATWEHEGKKGFYALTQFEPTSARRAFPLWDEPAVKATYTITMIHRSDTVALSNMPVKSTRAIALAEQTKLLRAGELELGDEEKKTDGKTEGKTEGTTSSSASNEWSITAFETTPKVSSYLVAWANGPFKYLEASYTTIKTGRKVPLRIYTTPEYIHQAQLALDVKVKALPVYEEVFDLEYPLPKLDTLVASDFDAGAMENWGLITGRTSVYLYDEKKAGLAAKKTTASVQSHELAHQWFGNIVTLTFWDCLWLNEAFATLMGESIILDRIYPEWRSSSEFINNHLSRALELDAKRSSHPIEVPLQGENVEDAVNQVFDAISYSKGASVLNMLSHMIGEDVFLKGVSIYLKNHLYGNAVTADLWKGISESSGLDVGKIMGPWVLKQGFPVITVTEEADAIKIRQNRFLATGDVKPEEDETLWYVPLALRTIDGASGKVETDNKAVLDTEREIRIPLKGVEERSWKLNADTVGVYRVAYSPERLAKLGAEAAKPKSGFTLEDRVGLVSDASTLARAGYSKTSGALNLILALREEPSYLVNAASASTLRSLGSVWFEQPEAVRDALAKFRADVFGPQAKNLGFDSSEEESSEVRDLRATVVAVAVGADDGWAVGECKRRFAPILEGGEDSLVPNDLRQVVFYTVARLGGEAEYEALLKIYKEPATPNHKIAAMLALCAPTDEALLKRTIELLFSGDVKLQDWMYFFGGLAGNRVGRRMLWAETKERYEQLYQAFDGNYSLSRLIEYSFSSLTTKADLEDVQAFFKDKDVKKYSMGLQQGLDSVRANSQWLERDAADVEAWLKSNKYLDDSSKL
ncbi:unnamed protein product [Tilletia controversa]|uniref:Aminopeptidase n=1 Tax=Tilletia caries TaxID=13290 RepID=A0ABN7ITT0_9BASI|nr:unnamed protein product [Tilletia caries]CAD6918441.1 unnamed protein product [Tilletia caries]CAD6928156.1 unnamed protein product [Tilletia controversa]CAD7069358.1 unnamed protein product [Tilletia caries]